MGLDDKFLAVAGTFWRRELAACPELIAKLGEPIYVQGLSAWDAGDYTASQVTITYLEDDRVQRRLNLVNLKARLLVKALVNEAGERIFRDDQVEALGRLPDHVLDPLYDQARRLSRLDPQSIEELEKNLSGRTSTSPSCSPASSGSATPSA